MGLVYQDGAGPEPVLALAESLRAAGEPKAAEGELRRWLEKSGRAGRRIWDLWLAIVLTDLYQAPASILANFPSTGADDYGADVRWLFESLGEDGVVRINCGERITATALGFVGGR